MIGHCWQSSLNVLLFLVGRNGGLRWQSNSLVLFFFHSPFLVGVLCHGGEFRDPFSLFLCSPLLQSHLVCPRA